MFGIEMSLAREVASNFGLRPNEHRIFEACWAQRKRADHFAKRWSGSLEHEVKAGYRRLAGWVRGKPSFTRGHSIVRRRPSLGARYVIFSDHHWSYDGHRQDFFGATGNRELYVELLGQYLAKDYCLVENGDVEELLVFEPTLAEAKRRRDMNQNALERHRLEFRLKLLRTLLRDPALRPVYDALAEFQAAGRLVRVAGNHDTDLQRPEYLAALRTRIPGLQKPCDYLFLTRPRPGGHGAEKVEVVIAHGHQFDKSTNGRYARRIGETVSETMSWAYQGADRNWRWDDGVKGWGLGQDDFCSDLVSDNYDHSRGGLIDMAGVLFSNLHSQDAWEALFKHNIAWEYFENSDPQRAVDEEVRTGDEFFKFRHLDELTLKREMSRHFRAVERPTLILGHSHEVRHFERSPQGAAASKAFRWYLNSGSAGRFENLLWAVEVEGGVARLVSWSRPSPKQGQPQRRIWDSRVTPQGNVLRAARLPSPL